MILGSLKRQLKYAAPFGFAGVLWILQTDVHNYFVFYKHGEANFAVYTYGCFQFPLLILLYEAVSSVMIPRMSQLQSEGDVPEMIATNIRAMNKIALVYLPIFAFFMIMATPIILALFTEKFIEAVPIFRINILLLPIWIFIVDPITRAYEDLGKFLLKFRIFLVSAMIAALWFGNQYFDLRGMIAIVVVSVVIERIILFFKLRKVLDLKFEHIFQLKTIALISLSTFCASMVLLAVYLFTKENLYQICLEIGSSLFGAIGLDKYAGFVGGSGYLGICFLIFGAVYYMFLHIFGGINEEEKGYIRSMINRFGVFSSFVKENQS